MKEFTKLKKESKDLPNKFNISVKKEDGEFLVLPCELLYKLMNDRVYFCACVLCVCFFYYHRVLFLKNTVDLIQ